MTAARHTLLPPNASALERAVDQAAPRWDGLADAGARPIDGSTPQPFKPWLATEWALADFARYFDGDIDALIDAALPWLMERGTPAAVRRALSWIGFASARLDEDGPWLHIDLGRAANEAELAQIAHLVRASVPAHVDFYRVYWQYDLRPIWLDARPEMDFGVFDNESGITVQIPGDDPLKASFGLRSAGVGQPPTLGPAPHALATTAREQPRHPHLPALDAWAFDGPVQVDVFGAVTTVRPSLAPPYVPLPTLWLGLPITRLLAPAPAHAPTGALASHSRGAGARPVPLPRGWTGTWDTGPWATSFPYRITTETV